MQIHTYTLDVANLVHPETYGFVVAEETHTHEARVPALFETMARVAECDKRSMKCHVLEREEKRPRTMRPRWHEDGDGKSLSSEKEDKPGVNNASSVFLNNMVLKYANTWTQRMTNCMEKFCWLAAQRMAVKRTCRHMVRAKRKAARENCVRDGKVVNPSASGVLISKAVHLSATRRVRRFLPGSKESGSALPATTKTVGLLCHPRSHYWLAIYRNTAMTKRRPLRVQ